MKLLCFSLFLLLGFQAYAKTKIGYSGRLVRSNGQPINGTADLRFDLHYTGDLTNDGVLCWVKIVSVPLSNGVYNVNLDFESGDGACTENFNKVLKDVPANEKLVIRVHDLTNLISFDWQDLLQVPYAYRAEYTSVAETAVESSIGSLEIIDESIKSEDIMNGTIQEEDLKSQAVTSNKIATSTIDDTHIANDSITSANLGVDSVTESEIATGAVRSDEVLDDSLTADDLAPDSVTVSELADNSVDTASIIAGSVTHTKMQGVTGNCPDKRFLETDGMGGFYCGPYQTGDFKSDGTVSMGGDINLGDNRLINALGVRLNNTGGANSNYVELKGPTSIANNFSLTLPADGGASGQVLTSDGSGVLSWTNPVETSRGSVSASSPLTYNSSTGVFGITEASGSYNGYLSN
ncbi:MAG: hypothetical protein WD025_08380, partial [Bacteriovoracaceae bacterium]